MPSPASIILLVNLIGGVVVGLLQHKLGITEALGRYALLTVGDGLVTQIPALIISTAAGIVVSRASSEQDSVARVFHPDFRPAADACMSLPRCWVRWA